MNRRSAIVSMRCPNLKTRLVFFLYLHRSQLTTQLTLHQVAVWSSNPPVAWCPSGLGRLLPIRTKTRTEAADAKSSKRGAVALSASESRHSRIGRTSARRQHCSRNVSASAAEAAAASAEVEADSLTGV